MGKSNKGFGILVAILILSFIAAIFYVTADTRNIVPFAMDYDKVLSEVLSHKNRISPIKLAKIIVDKDSSFVLVDIRSQFDYDKGHLPGATNIFKADILEKDNLDFFRLLKAQNKSAILYGNDAVEANAPFMILQQIGIDNVILLESGYSFFEGNDYKTISEMGELDLGIEVAAMDFAKLINSEKTKAKNITVEEEKEKANAKKALNYKKNKKSAVTKKTVVTKKKQIQKTEKKNEEEEEDEGC